MEEQRSSWADLLWFVLIVGIAGGARFWYLQECMDQAKLKTPPYVAQDSWRMVQTAKGDQKTELDLLVMNIQEDRTFATIAPLSQEQEDTAHVAPGYPWMLALLYQVVNEEDFIPFLRWIQAGLGALTAGFYFLFARWAFRNVLVAFLTGILCALHPLWIVNTGQVNDGVLASFLLAGALMFGTRAGLLGEAFSSLVYGLALAGLTLVRAVMLPFAIVGLLWFLFRCRSLHRGWLCALLVVLGFANGVAPWTVRNYQVFGDIVPVADSTFLHLYKGNNSFSTGGPQSDANLVVSLEPERLAELRAEESQPQRYQMLATDIVDYVNHHPVETIRTRINSTLFFFLGQQWFSGGQQGETSSASEHVPDWLYENYALILNSVLLGMLLLGLLGWRWTAAWRKDGGLAGLAAMWIPLPYILSHAEYLWGPRLPMDGIILCFAAFAVVYMIPGVRGNLAKGPEEIPEDPGREV